jgi:ubiquinone/menaquinone biosynthesis C-methylase UbiE
MVSEYSTVTEEQFDRIFDEAYLEMYAPRHDPEQTETEALGAARIAEFEPGAAILDCPCGFGRHSLVLAQAGYRVTGADRSQVLLDEAQRRAGGIELELVQADYRQLPFEDDSFDAVLNLFTALCYVGKEGDAQALAEFRRVLRTGGRLVVETMHRDRLARIFSPRTWDRVPTGYVLEERNFDQAEALMRASFIYIRSSGEQFEYPYTIRCYTPSELVEMARAAGFESVECYGGFDKEELPLETRLVLVAG